MGEGVTVRAPVRSSDRLSPVNKNGSQNAKQEKQEPALPLYEEVGVEC